MRPADRRPISHSGASRGGVCRPAAGEHCDKARVPSSPPPRVFLKSMLFCAGSADEAGEGAGPRSNCAANTHLRHRSRVRERSSRQHCTGGSGPFGVLLRRRTRVVLAGRGGQSGRSDEQPGAGASAIGAIRQHGRLSQDNSAPVPQAPARPHCKGRGAPSCRRGALVSTARPERGKAAYFLLRQFAGVPAGAAPARRLAPTCA